MCCFHMSIARRGGGGGGVNAGQNGLGHFFSTFACLTEGGLKLFGQCPYRINTFQKGASLRHTIKALSFGFSLVLLTMMRMILLLVF